MVGHLHHWHGTSAGRILSNKVDHLAGHIDRDGQVCTLAVRTTGWRHTGVICQWGCLALRHHVGNDWMFVGDLLLLGAMVWRRSMSACQGQDRLMHAGHQPTHHVGVGCKPAVCRAGFSACLAHMGIFDVTTIRGTKVPIFIMLEGSRGTWGLLCAHPTETVPGWLLVAYAVSAAASTAASSSTILHRILCRTCVCVFGFR